MQLAWFESVVIMSQVANRMTNTDNDFRQGKFQILGLLDELNKVRKIMLVYINIDVKRNPVLLKPIEWQSALKTAKVKHTARRVQSITATRFTLMVRLHKPEVSVRSL